MFCFLRWNLCFYYFAANSLKKGNGGGGGGGSTVGQDTFVSLTPPLTHTPGEGASKCISSHLWCLTGTTSSHFDLLRLPQFPKPLFMQLSILGKKHLFKEWRTTPLARGKKNNLSRRRENNFVCVCVRERERPNCGMGLQCCWMEGEYKRKVHG